MSGATDAELGSLLRDARLDEARALLAQRVKAAPTDARARLDLAELLVVLGEWDKADGHADLASSYDTSRGVGVALFRQLIRAATWRDETFRDRRPPDLVIEPDGAVTAALAGIAGTTAGAPPDDAALEARIDGRPIDGLRDLDDRLAGVLEVIAGNGRYIWISWADVAALRPAKPERLRDLVWRPAEIEVRGGPSGTVYLPMLYPGGDPSPAQRLGRETDWVEAADGGIHGVGLKCLLAGDDIVALDGFGTLEVAP